MTLLPYNCDKDRPVRKVTRAPVLIGLLDSGVPPRLASRVVASRAFGKGPGGEVVLQEARADRLGHGSALAGIIAERVPEARFLIAQIFTDQLVTSAGQAAAGLDWLVGQGARVINMSFGLRADRHPLAQACRRALAAGTVLVAASPAVGAPVFPSAYPGVIRVTGDVRCGADDFSQLDSAQADYGACVRVTGSPVVGASVATAYVSSQMARYFSGDDADPAGLHDWLRARASYRGIPRHFERVPRERRLCWLPAPGACGRNTTDIHNP